MLDHGEVSIIFEGVVFGVFLDVFSQILKFAFIFVLNLLNLVLGSVALRTKPFIGAKELW